MNPGVDCCSNPIKQPISNFVRCGSCGAQSKGEITEHVFKPDAEARGRDDAATRRKVRKRKRKRCPICKEFYYHGDGHRKRHRIDPRKYWNYRTFF